MFLKIMYYTIAITILAPLGLIIFDIYKGAMADANKDWEEKHNGNNKI